MILAEAGGVADEQKLAHAEELQCQDEWARGIENAILNELYLDDVLESDEVVEPVWNVGWQCSATGYGVDAKQHRSEQTEVMGATRWDAAIKDLDTEFHKLTKRTFAVDREATLAEKQRLEALFDGILKVRIRGNFWWTMGMTGAASQIVGLEGLMLHMVDNPHGVHRLMNFLLEDHLAAAEWYESNGLDTEQRKRLDWLGVPGLPVCHDCLQETMLTWVIHAASSRESLVCVRSARCGAFAGVVY